ESCEVKVERLSTPGRVVWALASIVLILAWGTGMARFTNAAFPYLDGANAVISIVAQILLSFRKIENWPLWILVDVIAIGLYIARSLWATTALYVLLLGMSVWGWIEWARVERRARAG